MRLGVFMMPLHRAGRPMHDCLAEDTEKALLMEELGFDELFIGEHFSAVTEPYPAPLMFAASLLPRTERLVFGTGVINAPLRHPALIAAEAAQFDHLSKGRFILGIGTGSTPTDNEMLGISADPRERGKMLLDSIEMIERIWASDPPYDLRGTYWNTQIGNSPLASLGFGQLPKPYQKPGPLIAVPSSTGNSTSVQIAGRKGWSLISGALLPADEIAMHWQTYRNTGGLTGLLRLDSIGTKIAIALPSSLASLPLRIGFSMIRCAFFQFEYCTETGAFFIIFKVLIN